MLKNHLTTLTSFALGALVFGGGALALAWTGPTGTAPGNNVAAPINVGTTDQTKNASLGINGLAVFGNTILSGALLTYLNFGTTAGTSGYGIRNNGGTLEFKNSGGSWYNLNTTDQMKFTGNTAATCSASTEGTLRYNPTSKTMEFCNGTSWSSISYANTSFTVSSDTQNANLYVIAGSPSTAGNYTITINPGVTVGSASTAASLQTGSWPAGSTVTLINNGNIYGMGGAGGAGGAAPYQSGFSIVTPPAGAGNPGGLALSLGYNITIDNTNGNIFGGGGGGGGSSGNFQCNPSFYPGSAGGVGQGSNSPSSPGPSTGSGGCTYASGAGGVWATAGSASPNGAAGGAGGSAISLNGKTITWLGGNNSTHVKGAVQ